MKVCRHHAHICPQHKIMFSMILGFVEGQRRFHWGRLTNNRLNCCNLERGRRSWHNASFVTSFTILRNWLFSSKNVLIVCVGGQIDGIIDIFFLALQEVKSKQHLSFPTILLFQLTCRVYPVHHEEIISNPCLFYSGFLALTFLYWNNHRSYFIHKEKKERISSRLNKWFGLGQVWVLFQALL